VIACLLLLSSPALPQQDGPEAASGSGRAGPPALVAPLTPTIPRIDRAFTFEEIALSLSELAAARPRFARLASIGTSQGGREIFVLSLSDHEHGDPGEKPGIFLAGFGPAQGVFGAEAILGIARAVLEGDDETLARRLADTSLYLAPALDPDVRAGGGGEPEILFDRNFPYGWQPRTVRTGSGAYPLAIPETLASVQFLDERSNLSLVVGFSRRVERSGTPWKGADFPAADRQVLASLGHAPEAEDDAQLATWAELGSPGGGLLDYAFQGLGVYPCAFQYPLEGPQGLESFIARAAQRTEALMRALPRLRLETEGLAELAPGLWQLDVAVKNTGRIPTQSELGERRHAGASFRVSMGGAKLVATAHRSAQGAPYLADRLNADARELAMGQNVLLPGETRFLRLIVEGAAGSSLEVQGSSERAGRAALSVSLQ